MSKEMSHEKVKKSRNYSIDIMKLILSVFVVLIHAEVDLGYFTPFLRTAVPLFFITSSYFFFKKIDSTSDYKSVLRNFLKRNMILYCFWFILLLPITLFIRDWFDEGVIVGIGKFLQSFFFNSTFRASWYLMALNIGMCISLLLSRKLTAKCQLLLTLPVYLICCLFTNYYGLATQSSVLMTGYNGYIFLFSSLANSFPVSLFWISMGRLFAERKAVFSKYTNLSIVFSAILLVAEYAVVGYFGLQNGDDCYIMLIPLCYFVFCRINSKKSCSREGFLKRILIRCGNISTIIYVSHASVITVLSFVLRDIFKLNFGGDEWLIFALTMAVCLGISALFFTLQRQKYFKWVKYSY